MIWSFTYARSSTTTKSSVLLTFWFTTNRKHLSLYCLYCYKVYKKSDLNLFWFTKNRQKFWINLKRLNVLVLLLIPLTIPRYTHLYNMALFNLGSYSKYLWQGKCCLPRENILFTSFYYKKNHWWKASKTRGN